MTATNRHFKFNTSSVIGGRAFNDTTEHPFIPVPHRILLDARFSLAARLFASWCYGKSSNYVFIKKNLCFELGITEQQRRTIFSELKKMGVLSDVLSRENNLHFWSLTLNFTIFDGLENLEERKKISSDLSTKKQNQQIRGVVKINRSRDSLNSTNQTNKKRSIKKTNNKQSLLLKIQSPMKIWKVRSIK